ncbi:MAG: DNA repair protein RadA [Kiloniella sp.]|nr:DNA repair protein RadA [Kiloniella sp.]
MARTRSHYVCQDCGATHSRWSGKCEQCGGWNTLVEEAIHTGTPGGLGKKSGGGGGIGSSTGGGGMRGSRGDGLALNLVELTGAADPPPRLSTGDAELDRVTGGGLVPGSALLIGGDPGIGKSTLLLQTAAKLARGDQGRAPVSVAYVSGEESVDQVRLRAERLEAADAPVQLAAGTAVRDILTTFDGPAAPDLLIIDSIQTMYLDTLESAPGTVAQVRGSAQELIGLAKRRGTAIILVGHVTKEGSIAGPKVVEHMVDAVLHFEGERGHPFRILRAIKNRFGPADEIGVYEMAGDGLATVVNPSSLFLGQRGEPNGEPPPSGTAVFAGIEGSRPVLVEIQALVNPSPLGTPRRTVVGWDSGRLAMVLAVLESRSGISFASQDVFLNVAGGLRLSEPAADLAVAAALVSSIAKQPVPANTVLFGEIGLTGEVRPVPLTPQRLKEAEKLGFEAAVAPFPLARGKARRAPSGLDEHHTRHVTDLTAFLGISRRRKSSEDGEAN